MNINCRFLRENSSAAAAQKGGKKEARKVTDALPPFLSRTGGRTRRASGRRVPSSSSNMDAKNYAANSCLIEGFYSAPRAVPIVKRWRHFN